MGATPLQLMLGTAWVLDSGKRLTTPGKIPRPAMPGFSSLDSKRVCIPRQIPKNGRSSLRYCLTRLAKARVNSEKIHES